MTASVSRAWRSQENEAARRRPASARRAAGRRRSRPRSRPSRIDADVARVAVQRGVAGHLGHARTTSDVSTGVPAAIASSTGRPKPS